jgi:predicted P-loop ATPase
VRCSRYIFRTAEDNSFHPVLDYLTALTWDETPRLDTWLINCAGAGDSEYTKAVSALVLMAAVKRVVEPGCKFDEMVVFESGEQGLLKSTALRTLCPRDEWFSDDLPLNVDSKQVIERTLGKWIVEASDLSGMSDSKVEHLKGMLSRQVDGPVRMAYARKPKEQPRQFVIVGTTNSHSYLTDSTGNRRFWPVRLGRPFDIAWIRKNRDQLWAEAYSRVRDGESIRMSPKLYPDAELQQERRRIGDGWEEELHLHFEDEYQRVATDEIWEVLAIPVERRTVAATKRLTTVMQRLKFVSMTVRNRKNKVVRGWGRGKKDELLDGTGET